jgi:hypothetical protein
MSEVYIFDTRKTERKSGRAMGFHLPNRCFELSTLYTITLLCLYISKRGAVIPLTYTHMFDNWSGVRALLSTSPVPVTWGALEAELWCPRGARSSPQCACFRDYHNNTYWPDLARNGFLPATENGGTGMAVSPALRQKHADGILSSCLRSRPSWRKNSCGDFCRIHLVTPILLATFYMSILFSCVAIYTNAVMNSFVCFAPFVLGVCIIATQLVYDRSGGIISSLSVVSVMLESYYLGPFPPWKSGVFWSYHRFFIGALAVFTAVTHQARDVYLVFAYAVFGFFAGFLAYTIYLIRQGRPAPHSGGVCLHAFIGIGVINACLVLLVQQHWYADSPLWSTAIAPVLFACGLLQCMSQAPFGLVPLSVNLATSLSLLTAAFVAVVVDLVNEGVF